MQSKAEKERQERVLQIVAERAGYYRENPHRFAEEYLGIKLKLFQKILLWAMFHNYYFMYIASRSQGKSWISAVYACCRAILYPGTKIVVVAGTRGQGNLVLKKIQSELMPSSLMLRNEISNILVNADKAEITFRSGSTISVASPNQNARGYRSNVLIVDEFRIVDENFIDFVLRKFNGTPRHPKYLDKPEYAHLLERNVEVYLSSAWFSSHWSYKKCQVFYSRMLDGKKYFVCSLPYQLAIKEGLLMREQVEDEMSEATFNEVSFQIEMEALFYTDNEGSFFKWSELNSCRKLREAFPRLETGLPIPKLQPNERRILSVDVALMATKRRYNDASAICINSATSSSKNDYVANIKFFDTKEGLTTDELGMYIMRLFYGYSCTDLVLDTTGNGLPVYDYLVKNHFDPEIGVEYGALTCVNDEVMADRCKVRNARKCVWSVKATEKLNSQMCTALRNAIRNQQINLLIEEQDIDEVLSKTVKGYSRMNPSAQAIHKLSYIQTTLAINEIVELRYETTRLGNIRVFEKAGARKDRYSSLVYNYWIMKEIENLSRPRSSNSQSKLADKFSIRKPSRTAFLGGYVY